MRYLESVRPHRLNDSVAYHIGQWLPNSSNTYLYSNCILCGTPESFYLEVLFKPFKEQFNEPFFL